MHVTLHDVSIHFSEEEWSALHISQKTLFIGVMKENYENVLSLGAPIAVPELFQQVGQWEKACMLSETQIPSPVSQNIEQIEELCATDLPVDNLDTNENEGKPEPVTVYDASTSQSLGLKEQVMNNESVQHPCLKCKQFLCQCVSQSWSKKKPYSCIDCGKRYSRELFAVAHQKTHLRRGIYNCPSCEKSFQKPFHLQIHLKTHEEQRIIKCPVCEETFVTKGACARHRRQEHGRCYKKGGQCNKCGEIFKTQLQLKLHNRVHRKAYHCNRCEMLFSNKSDYQTHQRRHAREEVYACRKCKKVYSRLSSYMKHNKFCLCQMTSSKSYENEEKIKSTSKSLLIGLRKTDLLSDNVIEPSSDNLHLQKPCKIDSRPNDDQPNDGDRKESQLCYQKPTNLTEVQTEQNRTFSSPHDLPKINPHQEKEWKISREDRLLEQPGPHSATKTNKIFRCKTCNNVYRHESSMIRHRLSHTTIYVCQECGKTFTKFLHIYIHRIEHKNRKSFNCSICRKGFSFRSLLRLHQNTHTSQTSSQGSAYNAKLVVPSNVSWLGNYYRCSYCVLGFNVPHSLLLHQKLHNDRPSNKRPNRFSLDSRNSSDKTSPVSKCSRNDGMIPLRERTQSTDYMKIRCKALESRDLFQQCHRSTE
ncbi:zinc finger protein 25-like [Pelobates fuscus]|uniref:zinc finger protein 25-like n=1 Tax=Pelobates fuscus TaxID=191477 RepID=UPI002FE4E387